jgi:hypothetical protein
VIQWREDLGMPRIVRDCCSGGARLSHLGAR